MNHILKINGFPIDEAVEKLKKIKSLPVQEISAYQEELKWAIFKHHCDKNIHYRRFLDQEVFSNWLEIPVLKKSDIQLPLNKRFTEGYSVKNSHVHNTSGSTGTPFFFAKDKFCHALSWAIIHDRFSSHGIKNGKDLQARFYGIPKGRLKGIKERIKDCLIARIRFPVFDLSDKVLDQFLKKFIKKPFVYVNGYTSCLVMMAKYCIEKGIKLKSVCPSLQKVFTTSEVCDNLDRSILEKGFGVPVVNEYGAAELDLIGFEDQNGDWLLNYETLFVEILGEDNQPVAEGQEGRVVVTSLYNKAMPFIRYDLGDRAILKKEKKGSYNILKSVTGRTNDIAILPSGKLSPGLTFYYISKKLLEGDGFMKEFVIVQRKIDHFHYEYVARRELNKKEMDSVRSAMDLYLEKGLVITFEKVVKIKRAGAGKIRHFYSTLNE